MGSSLSRAARGFSARNERRVLLVGLDNAGKTTVFNRLTGATEGGPPEPTTEAQVASFKYRKYSVDLWDVGGMERYRPYWRHHYTGTQGIIFVVDTSDRGRIGLAAAELHNLAADAQLTDVALLVMANKADMPGAMSVDELSAALELPRFMGSRPFHIQRTVARTGEGVEEGLDVLCANMKSLF